MVMLPGRASSPQEYRLSYWLVDATEQEKMIQQYLDSSSSSTDDESLFNARIAIQNSTDTPQLAKKVALLLSQNGFQNVYVAGNHSPQLEKTQIIVQKGDRNTAKKLFSTLNFGEVEYSSTGVLDSDVTIVLGKDTQAFLENQ
jgi:hypothetical protein